MKKMICLILSFIMIVSLATSISASIHVNRYNYDSTYDEASVDSVVPQGYTKHGRCGENVFWGYYESTKTLVIGGEGKHISRDSYNRVYDYEKLPFEKVVVQEGITELGAFAFNNCENMKEIELPDSLVTIGDSAFANCKSLLSVTIPKNVNFLGLNLFYYCESLEELKVDPENETFDSRDNCNGIIVTEFNQLRNACKNTTFPESVTNIAALAYRGVMGVTEITIPEHIIDIYSQAFEECVDLETIKLHPDVKLYIAGTFSKCKKLKNVYLPYGITSIGMQDFSECTSLEEIEIPASVEWINQSAFYGCTSLKTVTLKNGVQNIGPGAFNGCTSLEEIVIPESMANIQVAAFRDCSALKSVTVYNSECAIGDMDTTFPKNAVIYGFEGSTAQAYAKKYKRDFVVITEKPEPDVPTTVVGDVDLDGKLSVMDATEIQLVLAQFKEWENESCEKLADIDGDAKVSVMDATEIQLILAGLN